MRNKHSKVPWYSGELQAPPESTAPATSEAAPAVPAVSVGVWQDIEAPEDTLPHEETAADSSSSSGSPTSTPDEETKDPSKDQPGNLGAGPGKERSPGAAQERERRAGPEEGSPERERNPGAGPGNPGAVPERERSPGATQGREERLAALAEADPAVPGAAPERRLVGLHAAGPRAPRDVVLPPICVPARARKC